MTQHDRLYQFGLQVFDRGRRDTLVFAGTAIGLGVLSPYMAGEIRV